GVPVCCFDERAQTVGTPRPASHECVNDEPSLHRALATVGLARKIRIPAEL
ncbi:MAG: hypothetical protein RI908_1602, partial [Actinomycetota bacterium]